MQGKLNEVIAELQHRGLPGYIRGFGMFVGQAVRLIANDHKIKDDVCITVATIEQKRRTGAGGENIQVEVSVRFPVALSHRRERVIVYRMPGFRPVGGVAAGEVDVEIIGSDIRFNWVSSRLNPHQAILKRIQRGQYPL